MLDEDDLLMRIEIEKELKDVQKITLDSCSDLLKKFVGYCLMSQSGMYFFEVEDFLDQVQKGSLTYEMWEELESDMKKYHNLIDGAIELHASFDEVDESLDCVVTCFQSLPYYFV
ncbi:MAG: hypothetical protein Q3980_15715 [Turicibacter sp.]|nr:hypothetical protein [Turicibacter sp.]